VAAGTAVTAVRFIPASGEDAGQVLLEADAGFFRYASRVGIDSLQKIPDFLLNLPLDDPDLRTAQRGNLPWLDPALLDLVLHFRLHSPASPTIQLSTSGDPSVATNTWGMDKFWFWGGTIEHIRDCRRGK
jgi:hypothetical protein